MDKPQMNLNIAPPGEENTTQNSKNYNDLIIKAIIAIVGITLGIILFDCLFSERAARIVENRNNGFQIISLENNKSFLYKDLMSDLAGAGLRPATYDEFSAYIKPDYYYSTLTMTIIESEDGKPVVWWVWGFAYSVQMLRLDEFRRYYGNIFILVCKKKNDVSAVVPAEQKQVEQTRDWPVWKTITIGHYKSVDELRDSLARSGCKISSWTNSLFDWPVFKLSDKIIAIDLVKLTVAELGFPAGATYAQICDRAKELGLELCPAEVGPQLRLVYNTQPQNEWLTVAMEPITDSDGHPGVFDLERGADGLWLSSGWAGPRRGWSPGLEFVFRLRK